MVPDGLCVDRHESDDGDYVPSFSTAFRVFLVCRVLSVVLNNINDCDEVFNYWEPLHEILFGYGLQTWEYSPEYALRSYAFVGIYAVVAKVGSVLYRNKVVLFYAVRASMAAWSAFCEASFFRAIADATDGLTAIVTLIFMALSPGFFVASTSMLPSSFCMPLVMLAYAGWLHAAHTRRASVARDARAQTIASIAVAALLGWPFAAALGLPIAVDFLLVRGEWFHFFRTAIVAGVGLLLPMVAADFYYYGKVVIAPVSIVLYNVLSGDGRGPTLYGVEPWTYYVKNGFLNLNVVFPLALLTLPALVVARVVQRTRLSTTLLLQLSGLYLWLAIFFLQPHKEERFLYVVYPLFCWHGATTVRLMWSAIASVVPPSTRQLAMRVLLLGTCSVFLLLSFSRIGALVINYSGSLELYRDLACTSTPTASEIPTGAEQRLCVGKEWHRFPSHFFLPDNVRVAFLKSDFAGLLPKYYEGAPPAGTSVIPSGMNDLNLEDPSRYVDASTCNWIVDVCLPSQREPCWDVLPSNATTTGTAWQAVRCQHFLDAAASPPWSRAYYLPGISDSANVYGVYCLYAPAPKPERRRSASAPPRPSAAS